MDDHRPIRSFGRIKARTLKPRQAALMDTLLPHLALPEQGPIDVRALFASGSEAGPLAPPTGPEVASAGSAVLEIGFGGGEHLIAQAAAHPERLFIGVEPFMNGVASCLRHIEQSGVRNVRLHMGDARDVVSRLGAGCLDLCYILFPDPWPKARHHKRRLIQPGFVEELARALKPGAELRFATDWADYASWTLERFTRHARFRWLAERAEHWRTPWPGHVMTRYEAKRLGDCAPVYLRFSRVED